MKRILTLIGLLFFIAQISFAQADTIIHRYKQYLLQSVQPDSYIEQIVASMDANGQWKDINYKDTEPANWQPLIHLKRVRDLALVWANPSSSFYQQEAIKKTIDAGLNHWLKMRYSSSNWWHNEIGVPQQMRDILILLQPGLSPAQQQGALEVLAQYHVYNNTVGANLTWSADLGFHYGALTNNAGLMQQCRDLMVKEISITTGEGVQADYSFHQHGSRLQMYQYGRAFLWENVRIAWQLRETPLAFPQDQIAILTDFVLKGWQWMARGIHTVPGTMDRSASRKDALHSADVRALVPYLAALVPEKENALLQLLKNQNGKGSLKGFAYYPYSDFAAYHRNDFSFFLKTISSRTLATESINNENLKGHLLNSGDAYLIRDGEEYFNLMPVWDWEYLPGVTSFKGADKIKRLPFAGSVGDGSIGLTAMDYFLQDKTGQRSISAKKTWFCFGDQVLCLVAGLKGNQVDSAYTALDQCRWRDDVMVSGMKARLDPGNYFFEAPQWIYHSGFAYLPLGKIKTNLRLQTVSGSWTSINRSERGERTEKIFLPILLHDQMSGDQSFAYMLAHSKSKREAKRISRNPKCRIIRNDTTCQAVIFADDVLMVSFFQPSSIQHKNIQLSVSKPCLLLIKKDRLYASDPLQKGGRLELQLNDENYELQLDEHGFSTEMPLKK